MLPEIAIGYGERQEAEKLASIQYPSVSKGLPLAAHHIQESELSPTQAPELCAPIGAAIVGAPRNCVGRKFTLYLPQEPVSDRCEGMQNEPYDKVMKPTTKGKLVSTGLSESVHCHRKKHKSMRRRGDGLKACQQKPKCTCQRYTPWHCPSM